MYTMSMTSEIEVDGKKYVTSKSAAKEVGYTQDYIGQLARAGEILAERSGGLWYVNLESIRAHKAHAKEDIKKHTKEVSRANKSDSVVTFDAKEFISSKRASEITGYSQDYVTQLARSGKVLSRRISNRWYVYKNQLLEHKKHNDALLASVQAEALGLKRTENETEKYISMRSLAPELTYHSENKDLVPSIPDKNKSNDSDFNQEDLSRNSSQTSQAVHHIPIHLKDESESMQKTNHQQQKGQSSRHILNLDEILKEESDERPTRLFLLPAAAVGVLLLVLVAGAFLTASDTVFTREENQDDTREVKQTALVVVATVQERLQGIFGSTVYYNR